VKRAESLRTSSPRKPPEGGFWLSNRPQNRIYRGFFSFSNRPKPPILLLDGNKGFRLVYNRALDEFGGPVPKIVFFKKSDENFKEKPINTMV